MQVLIMAAQLLLSLSILVALHEFGHLFAAKVFGMRVEKYFIGFPPKVFSFLYKGTEYGLGALPMGGFVKISGMIDESLDTAQLSSEPQEWEFRSKPAWQRLIVMLGGIIMNIITGIVIFTAMIFVIGEKFIPMKEANYGIVAGELAKKIGLQTGDKIINVNGKEIEAFTDALNPEFLLGSDSYYTIERNGEQKKISLPTNFADELSSDAARQFFIMPATPFEVEVLSPGMPAAKADIRPGDRIVKVANTEIKFFHQLQEALKANKSKQVNIDIVRDGQTITKELTVTSDGLLGFKPKLLLKEETRNYGFFESLGKGTEKAFSVIYLQVVSFGKMFKGELNPANSVQGPIGMAQSLFGGAWNWENFWAMTGLLSMALAFMNLLPIPALDGGHVVFLLYEMISGRKPNDKVLTYAQQAGMFLLLSLIVLVFANDIWKLIAR